MDMDSSALKNLDDKFAGLAGALTDIVTGWIPAVTASLQGSARSLAAMGGRLEGLAQDLDGLFKDVEDLKEKVSGKAGRRPYTPRTIEDYKRFQWLRTHKHLSIRRCAVSMGIPYSTAVSYDRAEPDEIARLRAAAAVRRRETAG